jgi:hypothetical protein
VDRFAAAPIYDGRSVEDVIADVERVGEAIGTGPAARAAAASMRHRMQTLLAQAQQLGPPRLRTVGADLRLPLQASAVV